MMTTIIIIDIETEDFLVPCLTGKNSGWICFEITQEHGWSFNRFPLDDSRTRMLY
jgi:hypothetical protein